MKRKVNFITIETFDSKIIDYDNYNDNYNYKIKNNVKLLEFIKLFSQICFTIAFTCIFFSIGQEERYINEGIRLMTSFLQGCLFTIIFTLIIEFIIDFIREVKYIWSIPTGEKEK